MLLTGLALLVGAVSVAVVPLGGLAHPAAGVAYFVALVLAAPSVAALYGFQSSRVARTGLVGFALASMGAVLYGTGAFLVLPIAENIETAHDVWVYGMARTPAIPLGGGMFLMGLVLLGLVTAQSGIFTRWAGILLAFGGALWFLAFFFSAGDAVVSALLPIGSALAALAFGRAGWDLLTEDRESSLA